MKIEQEWALDNIINTDQCAKCGTCTILCPNNLLTFEEAPKLTATCLRKGHGTCHEICPRVSSGKYQIKIRENLEEEKFTTKLSKEETVNKIIKHLMDTKKIDGAILVGDDHWKSLSLIIKDTDELNSDSHITNYKKSPLDALKQMGQLKLEKIAIVALPCQINGFRKIQYFPYLAKHEIETSKQGKPVKIPEIKYLIGQYCTEKYDHTSMTTFLKEKEIDIETVNKFYLDIPKLKIETTEEIYELPIQGIPMNPGCRLCNDYEATLADISVGVPNNKDTSVIIRKRELDEFKDILELEEDTNDLPSFKRENKLQRFKDTIKERQENNEPLSYYWLADYPGVVKQADKNYFIRITSDKGGWYSPEDIQKIVNIASEYNHRIKITTRGAYELHDVKPETVEEVVHKLNELGLTTGSEGPVVRATLACPGKPNCGSGLFETISLTKKIQEKFAEYPTPYKFKFAVSGCPNKCVRPTIHDIGIYGVRYPKINEDKCVNCGRCNEVCKLEAISYETGVASQDKDKCIHCGKCVKACPNKAIDVIKDGFEVTLGGKSGREIVEGQLVDIKTEEELFPFIEKVLITYNKLADKPQRERIASTIERVGFDNFLKEVENVKL